MLKQKDFWTGVMFVAFGIFFTVCGLQYEVGTAAKMGPGYFPRLLAILVILIGIILLIGKSFTKSIGERLENFNWMILLLIIGPVFLFSLLLQKFGMIFSLFVLILISSYASHEFKWKSTIINAIALIVMCLVIFAVFLKLQFPILPYFISN